MHTDQFGRVKVQFHWDREGQRDEKTTCWVRVADSWAGQDFGFIQVPRIGQEVLVEYMEGDPDRPVITGRVYNTLTMPPWELPQQKTLSGIQSREFKASRRNQLVMDDTQGQIQAQLSSDHHLSQLNLGYLTRVNHHEGRKEFRGEGFELRTDGWGSVRAGKGLFISTDERAQAREHVKDLREAMRSLEAGAGQPHGEFTAPQLLVSSPAGIAATTPESMHLHSGQHASLTTGGHTSVASGKNWLATAMDKVSLFAHTQGMKLFAAKGKVEIQAQSGDLDIIADKVLQIISVMENVHISAPKEILLTAGDSYLKVNAGAIEYGTGGKFSGPGAEQIGAAAKTMPFLAPVMPVSLPELGNRYFRLFDGNVQRVANVNYIITDEKGVEHEGTTDGKGHTSLVEGAIGNNLSIEIIHPEDVVFA